jgi:YegS/Rv2252/BmrU family lipid kinase
MPKTLLIFNPMADRGRSGQQASDLRAMVDEMGGADWQGTEYPAHATEIAAQAALDGYQTIVALGGDGTVHEIVNGLMKIEAAHRPRLGIIPIGSGNDFAGGAGITMNNPQEAIRRAFTGAPKPVDVARITDGTGRTEYFDNTLGIGFDAAINIRSRSIQSLQGFMMYLTATLLTIARDFAAPHMKVTYDGGTLDEPLMMITVGNGPREGGGFLTTPESKMDDGMLDFVYIRPVSKVRMLQLVPKVMNGTHVKEKEVKIERTTRLVVDADRALPIHADGELFAPYEADVRHVEITIMPGAVNVIV